LSALRLRLARIDGVHSLSGMWGTNSIITA
jgi:hypothetical protein